MYIYIYEYGYIHHISPRYPIINLVSDHSISPTQQGPGHHAPLTFPHVIQPRDGEIIGLGGKSSTYPGWCRLFMGFYMVKNIPRYLWFIYKLGEFKES